MAGKNLALRFGKAGRPLSDLGHQWLLSPVAAVGVLAVGKSLPLQVGKAARGTTGVRNKANSIDAPMCCNLREYMLCTPPQACLFDHGVNKVCLTKLAKLLATLQLASASRVKQVEQPVILFLLVCLLVAVEVLQAVAFCSDARNRV